MAPFEAADFAAPQAQIASQLDSQLHTGTLQSLEQPLHSLRVVVVVDRLRGGGACRHLHHIAVDELLLAGLLQCVVEDAVVLAYGVSTQPFLLLVVEVLLYLGSGEIRKADIA